MIMKKLIFVLAFVLLASVGFGQRLSVNDTLNVGATDTVNYNVNDAGADNFFSGGPWSYQLDYREFDDVDATLGLYFSNEHPDSGTYVLLWYDTDLDGSNDNPWTLSDTANGDFLQHGEYFPGVYFIRVLTRGSVSDSTNAYEFIRKQ